MKKLENENVILTSNNDKVILTDHRIHMKVKDWGIDYSIGIFLEDISSIEVQKQFDIVVGEHLFNCWKCAIWLI
jgi:hypothetical protein